MAEVVSEETPTPPASSSAQQSLFRHSQKEIIVHQRRFGLAYLVLAIGVGVAVGLGIVLLGRGNGRHAATGTETFTPVMSGELGAKEIARYVGQKYRQADGAPLTSVIGERPNYQGSPLSYYLIRPHDAQQSGDIAVFTVGNGIMYTMCGFGKNCATASGGNSVDENLLLKREALELSLDTFRSDGAVQTVTTLLPPFRQGNLAIIFTRHDLAGWIRKPMSSVLTKPGSLKPGDVPNSELQRIDAIEAGSVYSFDAAEGPDGNVLLRLDPVG